MSDPTPDKPAPIFAAPPKTFAVSRAKFDSVPRKRSNYILAYVILTAAILVPRFLNFFGIVLPSSIVSVCDATWIVFSVIFYYNFFNTLRIMGFGLLFTGAVGFVAAFPLVGAIPLAYMDRRIAITWDAADPNRKSYRLRPPRENEPKP